MEVDGLTGAKGKVDLYSTAEDGTVSYLLNYPLYYNKRQYQFEAFAHEDYYYNNEPSGKLDHSTNTYTGNNVLTWTVRNPQAADLVDGDYFEIQRAMKADYSDAETVSVEMMERGEGKGSYSYKDESRSTWTGLADTERDTLSVNAFTTIPNYEVKDGEGNTLCKLNLKLQADQVYLPAVPVYYRIRRASSSVWGWNHEYAKTVSLYKHNFLTPLANNLADYTKDANYDENHQVHFAIRITIRSLRCNLPLILSNGDAGTTLAIFF